MSVTTAMTVSPCRMPRNAPGLFDYWSGYGPNFAAMANVALLINRKQLEQEI